MKAECEEVSLRDHVQSAWAGRTLMRVGVRGALLAPLGARHQVARRAACRSSPLFPAPPHGTIMDAAHLLALGRLVQHIVSRASFLKLGAHEP